MKYSEDQINELLVILMEEAAETVQAASKCYRFGCTDFNKDRLEKEVGDLQCMIDLLVKQGIVSELALKHQVEHKRRKLAQHSTLMED